MIKFRKLAVFLLACLTAAMLVMPAATAYAAEPESVSVTSSMSDTSGRVGDTVTLKITFSSENGSLGAVHGEPSYDTSKLELTGVSYSMPSGLISREGGNFGYATTGTFSRGTIGLKFKILDGAGGQIPVTVDNLYFSARGRDSEDAPVYLNTAAATVTAKIKVVESFDPATGVLLDKSSIEILGMDTVKLNATVRPATADQNVTWKSANTNTATVDADGNVTGVFRGKTTVTATTADGKKKATCTVNVDFGDINDVPAWKSAITWGADRNITSGYKETNTFGVNDPCTRGQAMVFLWRLAGKPNPKSSTYPFKDVPANATYKKAIIWAVEKGITSGYKTGEHAGEFGCDLPCTRGEIMVFLWRYKGKPAAKKGSNISFTDMPSNATYKKAIKWGASYSITGGMKNDDGTKRFEPDTTCSRGHIIVFLYKLNSLK